jgi:hypothetical protein
MVINSISYPNPVLGNNDDFTGGQIEPEFTYSCTDESIDLKATNLSTGHEEIDHLVETGVANWHIRVKCGRTYMRENYCTKDTNWTGTLSGHDYEGKVEIETQVIAMEDIGNYQPDGLHPDYEGEIFHIKSGGMLAIGPSFFFNVVKTFNPLEEPGASIFRIDPGKFPFGPFRTILENEVISIRLSDADWAEYARIRDRVPHILHSTIVVPVLAKAIKEIEDHPTTLWSGRLKDELAKKNIDTDDPLEAAQKILESPLTRAFKELNASLDNRG